MNLVNGSTQMPSRNILEWTRFPLALIGFSFFEISQVLLLTSTTLFLFYLGQIRLKKIKTEANRKIRIQLFQIRKNSFVLKIGKFYI